MENKNGDTLTRLVMEVCDIENNLKFIGKEMKNLETDSKRKDMLTPILDGYLSALFDVRNLLSSVAKEYGVVMIDILLENVPNEGSVQENIASISAILNRENDKLRQYTDALVVDHDEGLLHSGGHDAFFVLITESVGNILKDTQEIKKGIQFISH